MTWRISNTEFRSLRSGGRKHALRERVFARTPVGLLAYEGENPVGWCSIAPRETYGRLERSRTIPRIDGQVTWSVVCLYLDRSVRGRGLSSQLLLEGASYAAVQGAQIIEGYPVEPEVDEQGIWAPARSYRFMGYVSSFVKAGFVDRTPPGASRRVYRYIVGGDSSVES
jgi:GNAT superfamily N-acetyltransferase